jgi:hypothetical protein
MFGYLLINWKTMQKYLFVLFCTLVSIISACKYQAIEGNFSGKSFKSQISRAELLYYKIRYLNGKFSIGDNLVFTSDSTCTFSTCSSEKYNCNYYIENDKIIISSADKKSNFFLPHIVKIYSNHKLFSVTSYKGLRYIRVFHELSNGS